MEQMKYNNRGSRYAFTQSDINEIIRRGNDKYHQNVRCYQISPYHKSEPRMNSCSQQRHHQ